MAVQTAIFRISIWTVKRSVLRCQWMKVDFFSKMFWVAYPANLPYCIKFNIFSISIFQKHERQMEVDKCVLIYVASPTTKCLLSYVATN